MSALQVAQIANMGFTTLMEFLTRKNSTQKAPTKDEIKAYILVSTSATETLGHLNVTDRKAFNKGVDKMVDSVDAILKASTWK